MSPQVQSNPTQDELTQPRRMPTPESPNWWEGEAKNSGSSGIEARGAQGATLGEVNKASTGAQDVHAHLHHVEPDEPDFSKR